VDGGGTPAYSGEFAAYLYGSPFSTDDEGNYDTPFRAALAAMHRSNPTMAAIVAHVTIGGEDPVAAVRRERDLEDAWMCRAIAERALLVFWQRHSARRLDTRTTTAAA
jgi:hypothetical protein